jgi:hypothetical protein
VPLGSGRLLAFAVLNRLFVTPIVMGPVVLTPLLVLLSRMTSAQPADALFTNATTLVAPLGQGPSLIMFTLLVTGPLLGSNASLPRLVPGS